MQLLTDAMLGRLTRYLRMCGYDTLYALDADLETDDVILARARADGRVVLTRDRALASRGERTLLFEAKDITGQLQTLDSAGFDLRLAEPPTRCSVCNGTLVTVPGDAETPEYAPDPDETDVWRCTDCEQQFWMGSHWDDVRERLAGVREGGR